MKENKQKGLRRKRTNCLKKSRKPEIMWCVVLIVRNVMMCKTTAENMALAIAALERFYTLEMQQINIYNIYVKQEQRIIPQT